jgi:S1-C subfamily serine protease
VGIGFAIPSNLVRNVVSQLAETGKVERGFYGWQIEEPTRQDIEAAGLISMAGAKIDQVMEGGPAAAGGLKPDDIILEASGQRVFSRGDLRYLSSLVKPGGTLSLTYQREGKKLTTTLTAGRNEAEAVSASATFRLDALPGIDFRKAQGGITVAQIGKREKAKTGLIAGMDITEINGKPVTDFTAAQAALVEGVNRVKTRTGLEEQTLAIRLPLDAEKE